MPKAYIVARVTSVRGVRWDSFRVNFFLLLDPQSAQGIAYSDIASFHLPPGSTNALASLSHDYPNLSMIDLNALLDRMLDGVSGRTAKLIRKVKIEGQSVNHAARASGLSGSAVKVAIHRGLASLAHRFGGKEDDR